MEIDHDGGRSLALQPPEGPLVVVERKDAQISAAGYRKIGSTDAHRGRRELGQIAAGCGQPMGYAFGAGDAIKIVPDGKNAGVVREAFFGEDIDSTERLCGDGLAGRSVVETEGYRRLVYRYA